MRPCLKKKKDFPGSLSWISLDSGEFSSKQESICLPTSEGHRKEMEEQRQNFEFCLVLQRKIKQNKGQE
jgi:hypothetical protein